MEWHTHEETAWHGPQSAEHAYFLGGGAASGQCAQAIVLRLELGSGVARFTTVDNRPVNASINQLIALSVPLLCVLQNVLVFLLRPSDK